MDDRILAELSKSEPPGDPAVAFLLRLAESLHRYGVPAHRLEQALAVVARQFGLVARFYSTPTAIIASFGRPESLRTCMIRVEPGESDLARLAALDELTTEVMHGKRSPADASKRLEAILRARTPYGPVLTVASFGIASGGAGYLLGGQVREVIVATLISIGIGLMALAAARFAVFARMLEAFAAFGAAALAFAGERVLGPYNVQLTIIAGLIVLLPGLTLTVAMTELATRNLVSGTSRLMSAFMIFLEIGFGVALGSRIDDLLPPVVQSGLGPTFPGWTVVPAMILGTGAFAVLFKARPRDALWIVFGGSIAYLAARVGSESLGPQLGAFVGSLLLCSGSNLLARVLDKPAVITILPGLLLLVPGSIGYRSLDALLVEDVLAGVNTAFAMVLIAIAIVAGLLTANAMVPSRKAL